MTHRIAMAPMTRFHSPGHRRTARLRRRRAARRPACWTGSSPTSSTLVAVGRPLLADPGWAAKVLAGREGEVTAFTPAALGVLS